MSFQEVLKFTSAALLLILSLVVLALGVYGDDGLSVLAGAALIVGSLALMACSGDEP